jgi:hypothetical protein
MPDDARARPQAPQQIALVGGWTGNTANHDWTRASAQCAGVRHMLTEDFQDGFARSILKKSINQ